METAHFLPVDLSNRILHHEVEIDTGPLSQDLLAETVQLYVVSSISFRKPFPTMPPCPPTKTQNRYQRPPSTPGGASSTRARFSVCWCGPMCSTVWWANRAPTVQPTFRRNYNESASTPRNKLEH